MKIAALCGGIALLFGALSAAPASNKLVPPGAAAPRTLYEAARAYVTLVLRVDRHAEGYNDYYYGPPELKAAVAAEPKADLELLRRDAAAIQAALPRVTGSPRRIEYLGKVLIGIDAYLRRLQGESLSVAQETRLLYDLDPRRYPESYFQEALEELAREFPGPGELAEKVAAWRARLSLAPDKVEPLARWVLEVVRQRTLALLGLPPGEQVDLAFVHDKPWSGYNYYQGNYRSHIELNLDVPPEAYRLHSYLAHEAYPGHHTELALREQRQFRDLGQFEYCVSPLFTVQGTMSEAIAEVGVDLVFPPDQVGEWLKTELFPRAGLPPEEAERWVRIREPLQRLEDSYDNLVFLLFDEHGSEEECIAYRMRYGLVTRERAEQNLRFVKTYRAYVFNYRQARAIAEKYVQAPGADHRERYLKLITGPVWPSMVRAWAQADAE